MRELHQREAREADTKQAEGIARVDLIYLRWIRGRVSARCGRRPWLDGPLDKMTDWRSLAELASVRTSAGKALNDKNALSSF